VDKFEQAVQAMAKMPGDELMKAMEANKAL
jgi:hypothetical protein